MPFKNDIFAVTFIPFKNYGMKKLLFSLSLFCLGYSLYAQQDDRIAHTSTALSEVQQIILPKLNNQTLLEAELARRQPGLAPKFAETMEVDVSPETQGLWEYLPNGNALWRLRILSQGAKSLNLGFTRYNMPQGGTMILYSPDYEQVMGPFSPADNEEHEQLWTPVLAGQEIVIEVQLPQQSMAQLQLELKYVNHDFIGFAEMASGSCNLDVICGEADGWGIVDKYRDIIQSVAVISTGGSTFCTGFLVNNMRQDCTPFFMTAYHCGINAGNAASLVTYWNYNNSYCRQPFTPASGANGNGSLNNFNTGAFFRAGWNGSDFTLVELDDPVSESANAFFAGWSAEQVVPPDTVIAIHHPNTQEKRISFAFDPTYIGAWGSGSTPVPNGSHVVVPHWDIGTTEGGSSGSPLFDINKRVVGQLHGGASSCNNNSYDSYGWFYTSWEGGGTDNTRLRNWLDPDDTGTLTLDGRTQLACSFFVQAAPINIKLCAPDDAVFTISVSEKFTANVELSLEDLPPGLTATFETNPIPPGDSTVLTISNTGALAGGAYSFLVSGTDGTETGSSIFTINVSAGLPEITPLIFPEDSATGIGLNPVFSWEMMPFETYVFEIAEDESFSNIIASVEGLESSSYLLDAPLNSLTTYYWRLKAANACGENGWTPVHTFTTGLIVCKFPSSEDVPKPISSSGTPTITSKITLSAPGIVDDVNVRGLNINHTWVGDLSISLASPSGTTITLMANPGQGFCSGNNVQVSFDDQSANPYTVLDAMCNTTPPAISGDFQPLKALSAFIGEPATGVWTLSVSDNSQQDGGVLLNWGLEVCTTLPDEFTLYPSSDVFESCIDGEITFTAWVGTAFDEANGVTLSAENLPPGATATFSPNPAQPGAEVSITLSGASNPGNFNFNLVANDGSHSGSSGIEWVVLGPSEPPAPASPAQNGTDVSKNPTFLWSAIPNATYTLQIATDPGMNNLIYTTTVTSPSAPVQGILDYCRVYYWTVSADNGCGSSENSEVFSFETLQDLTFNPSPVNVSTCNTSMATLALVLGECFDSNGVFLSAEGLPLNAMLEFSANPASPGSVVSVALLLDNTPPGTYTITLKGTDGTNEPSKFFNLIVKGPAAAPNMLLPADGATSVSVLPTFGWDPVSGASSYYLEVADDDNFSTPILKKTLTQTTFSLSDPLAPNTTFYWRVTAFNDCGGTTPAPFRFVTETGSAVRELDHSTVVISPNPASTFLEINFSKSLAQEVEATLYNASGVLLKNLRIAPGRRSASLELSACPPGVYLLQLKAGSEVLTERIILQK